MVHPKKQVRIERDFNFFMYFLPIAIFFSLQDRAVSEMRTFNATTSSCPLGTPSFYVWGCLLLIYQDIV